VKAAALLGLALACGNLTAQTQDTTQGEREREAMKPTAAESHPVIAVSLEKSHGMFGRQSIRMVRDGESTLFRTYDFGQRPEIGFWRHAISPSALQDFLLRFEGLSRAIPEDGAMMPGQTATTFEVTRAGEAEPSRLSFLPKQPELTEVMARVSTIEAELRNHPTRVLRGEARWRKESVGRKDIAMLDVTLGNPGPQRIQIENPAWERADGFSGLQIWLQAPPDGVGSTIDVLAKDIQAIDAAAVTSELVLAPGQHVSFAVRTNLSAVDIGKRKTGLDIRSDLTKSATQEFVNGKLSIDMGFLTVTP